MSLIEIIRFNSSDIDAHGIDTNLWQGALPPKGRFLQQAGFQMLVLCAVEHQPPAEDFPGVEVLHAPNDDADRPPTRGELRIAMDAASRVILALRNNRKVLVTCWAGRNRSGLVSALVLREHLEISGEAACAIVKMSRPSALINKHFQDCLRRLPAPNSR